MAELQATFLDVGQGDSTVAVLPSGGGVLVDCPNGSAPTAVDFLNSAQITSLELVVISHSDLDHAGGVVDAIKGFQGRTFKIASLVDRVIRQDPPSSMKYHVMLRELAQLMRNGIMHWQPYEGNAIQLGDVEITVLHPSEADRLDALSRGNQNDCSVALRIDYSGVRILLGADIQQKGWEWIVERNTDLKADIFKFPHHGAWYEGEPSLSHIMRLVDPSVVIISAGSTNRYGHPSNETLKLLRSLKARVRFICTQVTRRCHPEPENVAEQAKELLPTESRGGKSFMNNRACPCAGNVTVRISGGGVSISPTPKEHDRVIDLLDDPKCKV